MQSIPFKLIEKHQLENVQSIYIYIYMFVGQMRSKIQKVGTSMLPFVLPQGRLLGCRVKADGSAGCTTLAYLQLTLEDGVRRER